MHQPQVSSGIFSKYTAALQCCPLPFVYVAFELLATK